MNNKIVYVLFLAFFFTIFCGPKSLAKEAQSFDVSPVKNFIHLDPGAVHEDKIMVRNNGEMPITIDVNILPYQVEDYSYDPVYKSTTFSQIADWITVDEMNFYLDAGESKYVTYNIHVPEDVVAGGQYALITFDTKNQATANSNIEVIQSVGAIVYAEISGNTRISGEILDYSIKGFTFFPPISAIINVKNDGNVNNVVTTVLKIHNFFDDSLIYSNMSSPENVDIYPGTIREIETKWNGSPKIGIFNVSLTINYLDEIITTSKVVILCPVWVIFVLLSIIVVVLVLILVKLKKRCKFHRHSGSFGI